MSFCRCKRPSAPGKKMCQVCLDQKKEYRRRMGNKLKWKPKAGYCSTRSCTNRCADNRKSCQPCLDQKQTWRKQNPWWHRMNLWRRADKNAGRTYNEEEYVTVEFVKQLWDKQKLCYYCATAMSLEVDGWKAKNAATLERLDNKLAHTKINCVLACRHCNIRHTR